MDANDAQSASKEFYQRIRRQASLGRSGSGGDVTLLPEPTEIMVGGRTIHRKEIGEQTQEITSSNDDQSAQEVDITAGAVGGETLLNIPPCSITEEPGEQSQSLF